MTKDLAWKQLSTKTVYQDKWFHAMADRCQLPDGRIIEPYYRLGVPNWTNVVVVTEDQKIVLVKQFRYPVNTTTVELPGGTIDAGETPLAAAIREMEEETGYTSSTIEFLGSLSPNPALQSNTAYFYLATNAVQTGKQKFDEFEEIEIVLVSKAEILQLLAANRIEHGVQVGPIYKALIRLGWLHY